MKIISVINYKGGVGKTTITANIGAELAYRGAKVLMIDLDPQASLTFSFLKPDEWAQDVADSRTIKNWFMPSKKNPKAFYELIIEPHNVSNIVTGRGGYLHLLSSHLDLINVDLDLATKLGGANMTQAKQNFLSVHRRLQEGLSQLTPDMYDIVLIDCPPNFNIVTKNAIVASTDILIPAKPDYLSTLGIDYLLKSLKKLVKEYNEFCDVDSDEDIDYLKINPQILGVLFTMVQFYGGLPINACRPFISQTSRLGVPVFRNYFRENKSLNADAPQFGIPLVMAKNGPRRDIVAEIESIVTEFTETLYR